MAITRLLLDETATLTRAIALDSAAPVAAFIDGLALDQGARPGDLLAARFRAEGPGRGQAFVELETGEEALLTTALPKGTSLGAEIQVTVAAQARADKLATVRTASAKATAPGQHLERWRAALPGAASALPFETGNEAREAISAAFDLALSPSVTLPGGGALRITPTPALTALDIDTAGRRGAGEPQARAKAINAVAVEEAARQLSLRRLGGLAVIDCIGPIPKADGPGLKQAFLAAFRAASTRKASALAPSPFGLLEVSLGWRDAPLGELLGGPQGLAALALLALEQTARSQPGAFCHLALPAPAYTSLEARRPAIMTALASLYGARLTVSPRAAETFEVSCQ